MDHVDKVLNQWRQERPDLDVGPMGVIGRIKRLHDVLSKGLTQVYASYGLNAASFDVLATLRRSGAPYQLSPSALINWTMVTSGTMTNRIDRLEAQGLVERRVNPEDGRGSVVGLTQAGFALIDRIISEHVDNQHRLIAGLTPDQQAQIDEVLTVWLAALGESGPD